ncbi:DUF2147 domain-containing protein [Hymenobacter psychrophilus]|uniref:Uncharacterized conserved protein, DUF2147 family n=1 Tax=Hymenobacter psychrophilus TaxID=651662 RepID=A0A1H3FDH7_9BACT|nr:DUF2147 domain-containing protein [Hymenobacter psychrophilus]SDX88438.1 Uncharacterized conserved protein, DUF2147 family [Hymenobacter psychrophilus]
MNQFKKSLLILFVCLFSAVAALADNPDAVVGVWKNGEGTGMIQIYKSGDKYFGRLVWLKVPNNPDGTPRTDVNNPDEAARKKPLKGLVNMRSFTYAGDNKWEAGNIYDPKNGSDYSCEMTLVDPNTLEVRGFIGVSLFGRTDVWKRQVKK